MLAHTPNINNLLSVYAKANTIELVDGAKSFYTYNTVLQNFSNFLNISFESCVGCFVELSPANDYLGNLRSLVTLVNGWKANKNVEDIKIPVYSAAKKRAWNCLFQEKFEIRKSAPKISNFYLSIVEPDSSEHVVVDGHIYSIWLGYRLTMLEVAWSKFNYSLVSNDIRITAKNLGIIPSAFQGILWHTWKRLHNIKSSIQLNLFRDPLGIIYHPSEIKPFIQKRDEYV